MALKFNSQAVIKAKDELEKEISDMLSVLEDVEKESKDMDSCWMGRGRNMLDKKFLEFHEKSREMVLEKKAYPEHLDFLRKKYEQTENDILTGLGSNAEEV